MDMCIQTFEITRLLSRKEGGRVLAERRHLENRRRLKLEEDRKNLEKNYKSRNRSMSRNILETIEQLNTIKEEMMDQ